MMIFFLLLLLWRKQDTAHGSRNQFIENTRDYNTRNVSEVNETDDKMQIKLCNYARNV